MTRPVKSPLGLMPESMIATRTPDPLMPDVRLACAPALRPSERRNVLTLMGCDVVDSTDCAAGVVEPALFFMVAGDGDRAMLREVLHIGAIDISGETVNRRMLRLDQAPVLAERIEDVVFV